MLTIGSLFSGIGGLELGLERAGLGPVKWQVEIDDYATKVLELRWPQVRRYGDIFELDGRTLEPVDIICGGFPCQPVSTAGKRKGEKDDRWLWPEFLRIIRQVGPGWVVVENVPGLLTIDAGRLFGGILRDLAVCGYDAEWDIISAASVGARHRRDRLFIVAYAHQNGFARPPISIFSGRSFNAYADSDGTGEGNVSDPLNKRGGQTTIRKCGRPDKTLSRHDGEEEYVADSEKSRLRDGTDRIRILNSRCTKEILAWYRSRNTFDGIWAIEPGMGRVANGIPNRVDRIECLGNAVVPQVAEFIGTLIIRCEEE